MVVPVTTSVIVFFITIQDDSSRQMNIAEILDKTEHMLAEEVGKNQSMMVMRKHHE